MNSDTHDGQNRRMAVAQFAAELETVRESILVAVADLGRPLGDLVSPRVDASAPLVRAALTLCVAYNGPYGAPNHRLRLAAALEMLHLALGIHQLLVDASGIDALSQPGEDQRSFVGGTILAGDFCFSRSAQMASETENPKIVAIYAQALQDVSEGSLRELFSGHNGDQNAPRLDRNGVLLRSGALAAAELSGLDAASRPTLLEISESVIQDVLAGHKAGYPCSNLRHALPDAYRYRWQAFCDWLDSAYGLQSA